MRDSLFLGARHPDRLSRCLALALTFGLIVGTSPETRAQTEDADTAGSASLSIVSVPPGALVLVDGVHRGVTPVTVDMAVGIHRIQVVKEGYVEDNRTVSVSSGRNSVSVRLSPAPGARKKVIRRQRVEPQAAEIGEKKHGGGVSTLLLVGGATVAAGLVAAVALASGEPDPLTVDNDGDGFSENQGDCDDANPNARPNGPVTANYTSSTANQRVPCYAVSSVTATVTNRSCANVTVQSIRVNSGYVSGFGNCQTGSAVDSVTPNAATNVPPGSTDMVVHQRSSNVACCTGSCVFPAGTFCTFQYSYTVVTSAGELPAGSFQRTIDYIGNQCPRCQ